MRPEARLRSGRDFERVSTSGRRVSGSHIVLYHHAREAPDVPGPRVGFAVSRRIGGAVVRNRVRRLLREAIRPLLPRLAACDIVVVARPSAVAAGVEDLGRDVRDSAGRAGLLTTDTGRTGRDEEEETPRRPRGSKGG